MILSVLYVYRESDYWKTSIYSELIEISYYVYILHLLQTSYMSLWMKMWIRILKGYKPRAAFLAPNINPLS